MKKNNKFISLFLVFSLMMLSVNLYAKERRGAILVITKKDGGMIEGELIAVKKYSLLLFTGRDVSIEIENIKIIRIVKKSKFLQSLGFGLLIGAGSGALLFALGGYDSSSYLSSPDVEMRALVGGGLGGFFGILIGGTLGYYSGIDKKIQIEGMTDLKIQKTLVKLRMKARIPDFR